MPNYKIEFMERIDLLAAEGKTVALAKEKLDSHLESIGESAKRYFFLEVYSKGEVSGAMVHAEVVPDLERGSGIKRNKLPASDYLIVEATNEEYLQSAKGDNSVFNLQAYMKEHKLELKEFPVSERYIEDGKDMVRVYIAVKRK